LHDAAHARIVRLIAFEAGLAALAVGVGFALAFLPNVELFTFTVFLSGVLLGPFAGARVGVLAGLVYGLLNPYGLPSPVLLAALLGSRAVIGVLGGLLRGSILRSGPRVADGTFLVGGLLSTLVFQGLTTLAVAVTFGSWKAVILGAIPYALVNLAVNLVVFPLLGPSSVGAARRLPIPGLHDHPGARRDAARSGA